MHTYLCIHACIYVNILYVCVCVNTYLHLYMSINMYTYMCIYGMYTYVCAYTYVQCLERYEKLLDEAMRTEGQVCCSVL